MPFEEPRHGKLEMLRPKKWWKFWEHREWIEIGAVTVREFTFEEINPESEG